MSEIDYRQFYNLERYLFDEIGRAFSKCRSIGARDLFCIVIWKANRAKSKLAHKLLRRGYRDLESAARAMTAEIYEADGPRAKLKVLIEGWEIPLPMASAILTVLYPDEFTVYDVRVCQQLGGDSIRLINKSNFDAVWIGYVQYKSQVEAQTPREWSLRDKDRWMWGKSFCEQLDADIASGFRRSPVEAD